MKAAMIDFAGRKAPPNEASTSKITGTHTERRRSTHTHTYTRGPIDTLQQQNTQQERGCKPDGHGRNGRGAYKKR